MTMKEFIPENSGRLKSCNSTRNDYEKPHYRISICTIALEQNFFYLMACLKFPQENLHYVLVIAAISSVIEGGTQNMGEGVIHIEGLSMEVWELSTDFISDVWIL